MGKYRGEIELEINGSTLAVRGTWGVFEKVYKAHRPLVHSYSHVQHVVPQRVANPRMPHIQSQCGPREGVGI